MSPLERRKALATSGRGLRSRPRAVPLGVHVERKLWTAGLGDCAVCRLEGGSCSGRVQGHHVVAKQALKRRGLVDWLYDTRNRLAVCEKRHMQHESGFRRIPRALVPASAEEFAGELGLDWLLDRVYGRREEALCEPNA